MPFEDSSIKSFLRLLLRRQPGLDMWKANALGRLSSEQLADFTEAYQQIKFQIMAAREANGSSAVESAALEKMNGLTVRGVLEMGFDSELERVQAEYALRKKAMSVNTLLRTRPGDTDSQSFLEHLHEQQLNELRDEAREIARIKKRLAACGLPTELPSSGNHSPTPPTESPPGETTPAARI